MTGFEIKARRETQYPLRFLGTEHRVDQFLKPMIERQRITQLGQHLVGNTDDVGFYI